MTNRTRDLFWLLKMFTAHGVTMDACRAKRPIDHTESMVRNTVLTMDVATADLLKMDANSGVTQTVCYMDDNGYLTKDSMAVLGKCVAVADVSVVGQPLQDLTLMTLILALKRCVFEDAATNRLMWRSACHSRTHRRQSSCKCMAVKRQPMLPIVHGQMLATFDVHMMISMLS